MYLAIAIIATAGRARCKFNLGPPKWRRGCILSGCPAVLIIIIIMIMLVKITVMVRIVIKDITVVRIVIVIVCLAAALHPQWLAPLPGCLAAWRPCGYSCCNC